MTSSRNLFICSCIALVTSAFTFSLHGDVMPEMRDAFNLSQEQNGDIGQAIFFGMAFSMLVGGFICDLLGIKRIMFLAFGSHMLGTLGMVLSKQLIGVEDTDRAYWWLYSSGFLMGCGNGMTEVGINPLVATLYPREKTHYLNILHAWWPGGLIIGGFLAIGVRNLIFADATSVMGLELWQFNIGLIVIPAIVYGLMLVPSVFPETERVTSGVSNTEMLMQIARPMFLLWAFCMLLTASTELGPQKWQNTVMTKTAGVSGTLILVYTSGMMFVLRHFAGPLAHRFSPVGLLTGSAILSAIGLYFLSFADNAVTAFGFATIFGLGIAYFWPTMLGVTAERFPKGGALALSLMGTAGNLAIGVTVPEMGEIVDQYSVAQVQQDAGDDAERVLQFNADGVATAIDANAVEALPDADPLRPIVAEAETVGLAMAFRWVSVLPVILVFIFGAIALYDRARGGYQAEHLSLGESAAEAVPGPAT